jgi:hypothetical protein
LQYLRIFLDKPAISERYAAFQAASRQVLIEAKQFFEIDAEPLQDGTFRGAPPFEDYRRLYSSAL